MNTKKLNRKRRATILLLVVSILALLFVIVTGFLSVARNTRQLVVEAERGDTVNRILDAAKETVLTELGSQIIGDPESGTVGSEYEMIPGYRGAGRLLSSVMPVWSEGFPSELTQRSDFSLGGPTLEDGDILRQVVWPATTNLDGGRDARPIPVGVLDLIPEQIDDTDDILDPTDLERFSRQPRFDADGDGIPDTDLLRIGSIVEAANLIAGTPVRVRNVLRNEIPHVGSNRQPETFMRLGNPTQPQTDEQLRIRTAWNEFNDSARYDVSIRVVPHGGMLALDAPPLFDGTNRRAPWNRDFVTSTFDNLRSLGGGVVSNNPPTDLFADYPVDRASGDQVNRNSIFAEIAKAAPLVERHLRRRGGWLPSFPGQELGTREYDASSEPIPPILSFLQGTLRTSVQNFPDNVEEDGFQAMFLPDFRNRQRAYKRDVYQRFNLGELVDSSEPLRAENERYAFVTAATLPPMAVINDGARIAGINSDDWRSAFARRALLTTMSFSDDRPRRMDPALIVRDAGPEPAVRLANPNPLLPLVEAPPQQQVAFELPDAGRKFWLGNLFSTDAAQYATTFPEVFSSARSDDSRNAGGYYYDSWSRGPFGGRIKVGDRVIEALASRFYDMLASHSDTNGRDDWSNAVETARLAALDGKQVVSRRQQAFMLAVNTLAFGAPRSSSLTRPDVNPKNYFGGVGFVDVVSYVDWLAPTAGLASTTNFKYDEYVGYGPQPVMTEVIAYGSVEEQDDGSPTPPAEISIALELFNPNDPLVVNGVDLHGLFLDDFAISLNGVNPNDPAPAGEAPGQVLPARLAGTTQWRVLRPQSLPPAISSLAANTLITEQPNARYESIGGRQFRTFELQLMTRVGPTSYRPLNAGDRYFSTDATAHGTVTPIEFMFARPLSRTNPDPTTVPPPVNDNVGLGEEWFGTGADQNLVPNREYVTIDLWRKGSPRVPGGAQGEGDRAIVWYHVDRIVVHMPKDADKDWWTSTARDQSPSRHFGAIEDPAPTGGNPVSPLSGVEALWSRWRGLTDRVTVTHEIDEDIKPTFALSTLNTGGWRARRGGSDVTVSSTAPVPLDVFSPETAFPLMNAGPVSETTISSTTRLSPLLTNLPLFGNRDDLRPRSFPTVGFMSYIARFSHLRRVDSAGQQSDTTPYSQRREVRVPMSMTLAQQWRNLYGSDVDADELENGATNYAIDFGHMPMFDNSQRIPSEIVNIDINGDGIPDPGVQRYTDEVGKFPWGQLLFDYFSTINPTLADPDRIPGRIDINSAPWMMLAQLPMLGPVNVSESEPQTVAEADASQIPIRARLAAAQQDGVNLFPPIAVTDPSPAFWAPGFGGVAGVGVSPYANPAGVNATDEAKNLRRTLAFDTPFADDGDALRYGPRPDAASNGQIRYRMNAPLAAAAAAYRDGIQYLPVSNGPEAGYLDAHLRNGAVAANGGEIGAEFAVGANPQQVQYRYRNEAIYGPVRGQAPKTPNDPTIDPAIRRRPTEFGFVSVGELLNVKGFDGTRSVNLPAGTAAGSYSSLARGDFMKAVSLVSMLDSNAVTTRSNTFTVYISIMDREDPSQSVRTQMTIDRSNLIKQIGRSSPRGQMPEIISETRVGYFNTRYDQ